MSNTWVELDLQRLDLNLRAVEAALNAGSEIVFVVKSDAYGHGMLPVARRAWEHGTRRFAVVRLEEGLALREELPEAEILIAGVIDGAGASAARLAGLVPFLAGPAHARRLADALRTGGDGPPLRCHAKIDTGMGRIGFAWQQAAAELAELKGNGALEICGTCTHFAAADAEDPAFADAQWKRFQSVLADCRAAGIDPGFTHAANSAALQRDTRWHLDGVRIGLRLYGYRPGPGGPDTDALGCQPVLQWKTRVVQIKDAAAGRPISYGCTYVTERATRIATINAGYADGYRRGLSNRASVIIGGRRCPVAGRVTMNMTMVDVGPDAEVREGDPAVLIGSDGEASVWADELARICGTIPYEILTGIRTGERSVNG